MRVYVENADYQTLKRRLQVAHIALYTFQLHIFVFFFRVKDQKETDSLKLEHDRITGKMEFW